MMDAFFVIPGEPKSKLRARVTSTGHAYTPQKTVEWENLIRLEYQRQCRGTFYDRDIPLYMKVVAYVSIPKTSARSEDSLCWMAR